MEMNEMGETSESKNAVANRPKDQKRLNVGSLVSQKITIAGGFLDVALFVADLEHLKFIFDTGKDDIDYFEFLVALLITSLSLQILVGILLFIIGFNRKSEETTEEPKWIKVINHIIIGMVSSIAIIEIFVTKFGDRGNTIVQYNTRHNCHLGLNLTKI